MRNSPVKVPEAFWLNHIAQMEKNGLNRAEYSRKHGLNHKAFSNFICYYRRKQEAIKNCTPRSSKFIKKSLPTPTIEERSLSSQGGFAKAIIVDRMETKQSVPVPKSAIPIRLRIGNEFTIEFNDDIDPSWVACFISSMRS